MAKFRYFFLLNKEMAVKINFFFEIIFIKYKLKGFSKLDKHFYICIKTVDV